MARGLQAGLGGNATVAAVLVRSARPAEPLPNELLSDQNAVVFTTDPDAFFAADWDFCVEAAGQPAVRAYAARCLGNGRDFLATSIGALTDDGLYAALIATAEEAGTISVR